MRAERVSFAVGMNMIETVVQLWASVDRFLVFGNDVVNQPDIVNDGAGVCVDERHERTVACKACDLLM